MKLKVNIMLFIILLLLPVLPALATDLHKLWDDRCISCHGHSGEFSRKFLMVSNAELQGKHHVHDLRIFLKNHYLSGHDVEPIYNMLLAQVDTKPRFKNECSLCHDRAANFVRNYLVLRDNVPYSRKLNIPVSDFLAGHKDLQTKDIGFFMKQLTRISHEIE